MFNLKKFETTSFGLSSGKAQYRKQLSIIFLNEQTERFRLG
jgi:hypothetical protein